MTYTQLPPDLECRALEIFRSCQSELDGLVGASRRQFGTVDILQSIDGPTLDVDGDKAILLIGPCASSLVSNVAHESVHLHLTDGGYGNASGLEEGFAVHFELSTVEQLYGSDERRICETLATSIDELLSEAECKIWHRNPVWFLDENPIVGYSKLKAGIRLMFWSGASFDEDKLHPGTGKFKDPSIIFTDPAEIKLTDMKRWINKSKVIQWDYRNVAKRKGKLVRLKLCCAVNTACNHDLAKGMQKRESRNCNMIYRSPACACIWNGKFIDQTQ